MGNACAGTASVRMPYRETRAGDGSARIHSQTPGQVISRINGIETRDIPDQRLNGADDMFIGLLIETWLAVDGPFGKSALTSGTLTTPYPVGRFSDKIPGKSNA